MSRFQTALIYKIYLRSVVFFLRGGKGLFCELPFNAYLTHSVFRKSRQSNTRDERKTQADDESNKSKSIKKSSLPRKPPADEIFSSYVEEVRDSILPLPTTRDQVETLARYRYMFLCVFFETSRNSQPCTIAIQIWPA